MTTTELSPNAAQFAATAQEPKKKARPDRDLVVYSTKSGKWHWKLMSPNGQLVQARSGPEGYQRRTDAGRAGIRLLQSIGDSAVRLIVRNPDGTVDDRGLIS
ncbi:hypothetical protein BJD61_gp56 [Gordonia phage Obliviate]|uniref:DUF1508 domain-containing protein n=1 Tax=Gordonia phage JuJu TaxID=2590929 RepID=A0A516KR65_9CAUD|nr:hypothetical protein BJD61_gp56 [Gordonia phage Obliviate]YP_010103767.1 hypothetical protein KNU69_gp66 [Gordonia phage JuJu]AMS03135.1 hypothetical protein SEA_OBLIVIATE_56 [Gordonia phage Obliviate]QDP44182.1 hypothetical protein SEA_JUJU_66 [Gordonia phage JuJu]